MTIKHKPIGIHTLEEWNEIIEDCEKSGLSKDAYCKEKKISKATFYKWKSRVDLSFRKESYMKTFQEWESIIEDWKKSGLHKNAYCKEKNIEYFAFYAWERKINPSLSPKQIENLKKWEILIEDWRKSGMDVTKYCKEKRIERDIFFKWKTKISPSLKQENHLREKWQSILEDWKKSGLKRWHYCKEKKVLMSSFLRWEKKLDPSYKPNKVRVLEKWTEIIEDWKKSGLNRNAYCIQNDLTTSFYQWEKKINPSVSRKPKHIVVLEKWTEIIEDWKKSGLKGYVYCKKSGVPITSFYKWEKKLNPSRHSQPTSGPIRKAQPKTELSLQDLFAPFAFGSTLLNNPSSANPKIEVILSQGHRLSLEGTFDWEKLTAWLTPLLTR